MNGKERNTFMKYLACKVIAATSAFCLLAGLAGAQNRVPVAKPDGAAKAAAAVPHTADGHPNLSGVYGARGGGGGLEPSEKEKYGAVGFDPSVLVARQTEG